MMPSWICTRASWFGVVRSRHALAAASFEGSARKLPGIQRAFDLTYRARRTVFEDALLEARDVFARCWRTPGAGCRPTTDSLQALAAMLAVAGERHGPRVQRIVRDAFAARGIEPGTSP